MVINHMMMNKEQLPPTKSAASFFYDWCFPSDPIRLDCHYSGRGPYYVECSILSNDVEIVDEKVLHKDHEKHKTTIETDNWRFDVTDYVKRSGKVSFKKKSWT
jgi:hypothetical protein